MPQGWNSELLHYRDMQAITLLQTSKQEQTYSGFNMNATAGDREMANGRHAGRLTSWSMLRVACEWRGIGGAVIARPLCHRLCRILCQLEHHSTTTSSHLRHRRQFTFACTIVWNAKLHTLQAFIAARPASDRRVVV